MQHYIDQLRSFDRTHDVPAVTAPQSARQIMVRGDRKKFRQTVLSSAVVLALVAGGWASVAFTSRHHAPSPAQPTLATLEAEIREASLRLELLDSIWVEQAREAELGADYRAYVLARIDHELPSAMAAKTLLLDAQTAPVERRVVQLTRLMDAFADTQEAEEAAELLLSQAL